MSSVPETADPGPVETANSSRFLPHGLDHHRCPAGSHHPQIPKPRDGCWWLMINMISSSETQPLQFMNFNTKRTGGIHDRMTEVLILVNSLFPHQ